MRKRTGSEVLSERERVQAPQIITPEATSELPARAGRGFPLQDGRATPLPGVIRVVPWSKRFAPDRWQRFFFFLINSYLEAVPYGSEKVRSE